MDEQKLIDALDARADADARAFRDAHRGEIPTERWIENSYTAALPLAKADSGYDPGAGPHPQLFAAYRRRIRALLGERPAERPGDELAQMPTAGEH